MKSGDVKWEQECGDALQSCLGIGGAAGQASWANLRQKWLTEKRNRVTLHCIDLSGKDLRGYDLSRCWIGSCTFISSNLSGVNFSQSIFRDCDLTRANIRGASFHAADLAHPGNKLLQPQFDGATDMEVNRGQLAPQMDSALVDMAEGAWRRTAWRRRRSTSLPYKALSFLTDYGFGFGRIAVGAMFAIVTFGLVFYMADRQVSAGESLLISARYLIGLEDHYSATSLWLSLVGVAETTCGLVVLALVVAIFTSKFTDL